MTDLDTLIAAHPDAVTSVRTHDGHVVSHTVIVDTDTGRQAHTFDAGRLVERTIDHGDGTGTRTTYDEHGNETSVEQVTGLPIPEAVPVEITLADVAAALRDPLADLTPSSASTTVRTAILNQRAALDALLAALETP